MSRKSGRPRLRSPSRRSLLLFGGCAMTALAIAGAASAKTAKSAVAFQTHPNGKAACGRCTSYLASADPNRAGACKIVDGDIPADAWCELYAQKAGA